jgi:hypothetical protein
MSDSGRDLTRDELIALLTEVGRILKEQGLEADIYVVGGAAMALEFDARRITRDVDSALRSEREGFWEAVVLVAERHGLSPGWINAQATAFFTNEPDDAASEITLPGLRIAVASPEHLIAMKLRAMRNRDMDDLEVLFRHVGITDPQQAADIHNRLFDDSYIGYSSPDEALYAAERVFTRAAAQGRPISRSPGP